MAETHHVTGGRAASADGVSTTASSASTERSSTPKITRSTSSSTRTRTATAPPSRAILKCGALQSCAEIDFPRVARPLGESVTALAGNRARTSRATSSTTRWVRPTKKWLAPATISTRVFVHSAVSASISEGARIRRAPRASRAWRAGRARSCRIRSIARNRSGGAIATHARTRASVTLSAMSAPNDQPTSTSGSDVYAAVAVSMARDHVALLGAALVVRALTALDAAEVEAQARVAVGRQRFEQRRDHDAAHGAAVRGMRMAQHDDRRRIVGSGPFGFEEQPVVGCATGGAAHESIPSSCKTNARTVASSRHAS